jgi:hypothetical protein
VDKPARMPDELQREKMSIEVGTLLDAEEAPTSKSIKDTQLDEEKVDLLNFEKGKVETQVSADS